VFAEASDVSAPLFPEDPGLPPPDPPEPAVPIPVPPPPPPAYVVGEGEPVGDPVVVDFPAPPDPPVEPDAFPPTAPAPPPPPLAPGLFPGDPIPPSKPSTGLYPPALPGLAAPGVLADTASLLYPPPPQPPITEEFPPPVEDIGDAVVAKVESPAVF